MIGKLEIYSGKKLHNAWKVSFLNERMLVPENINRKVRHFRELLEVWGLRCVNENEERLVKVKRKRERSCDS